MNPGLRTFSFLVPSLIALDQLVKWWSRVAADGTEGRTFLPLWPGVFELKLVYNKGIAFGMLQGMGVLLAPIALAIAVAATWYVLAHPRESKATAVCMSLLAAGALGNLIDRLVLGKVTDMFWIRAIDFPVFNVADMCITFAGVMLVVAAYHDFRHGHHGREEDAGPAPRPDFEEPGSSEDG